MVEPSQIEQLAKLMAQYSLTELKTPEVELKRSDAPKVTVPEPVKPLEQPLKQELADEDMLFWSVDGQVPTFQSEPAKEEAA